jgi:hypothetical protein
MSGRNCKPTHSRDGCSYSAAAIRVLVYDVEPGFCMTHRCPSKGRFRWWSPGKKAVKSLQAHQA